MWILAFVGMVVGAGIDGFLGATLGATAGAALGWLLKRQDRELSSPSGSGTAPLLESRVAALEREVTALRRELAAVRGQPGTSEEPAEATAATTAPSRPSTATMAPPQPAAPTATMASARPVASTPQPAAPPASPAPRPLPAFAPPDLPARLFTAIRDWLLGGNSVVRIGILILFFGIAFLLKYAADNSLLPVGWRLAGVCAGAVVLLGLGSHLRKRRAAYGLALQGAGIGVLYLTIFAAARLYGLLPVGAAFALMVAVCALAGGLAVLQNAAALAVTGSAGGFLAPVLMSTGEGNHVVLFSYYALLNAGIFVIAWFRSWRLLNLLGFVFTFCIATAWGVLRYRPELLGTTEPFLVLFFLMYTGIAVLYALRQSLLLTRYVDGTLVFGTPLVTAGLQSALMRGTPYGMAWSSVALAVFYLALAGLLQRHRARLGLLYEAMLALGVCFATLAIPLAFDGRTTSAVWALEGAGVVWVSARQGRRVGVACGLLLQLGAGVAFLWGTLFAPAPEAWPVLNARYIGTVLLAVSGIFSGWCLLARPGAHDDRAPATAELGLAAAAWGLAWWLGGGGFEIWHRHVEAGWSRQALLHGWLLFAVLTAWASHLGSRALKWPLAGMPALALAPVVGLLAIESCAVRTGPPLGGIGLPAWLLAFVAAWWLLRRQQHEHADRVLAPMHALLFLSLCVVVSTEGYWRLRDVLPGGAWRWSAWAFGHGALLAALAVAGTRLDWPVRRFARAYLAWAGSVLAVLLWLWSLGSLASDGAAPPLPYIPFLNPVDLGQMLALAAFGLWHARRGEAGLALPRWTVVATVATGLLWLNAVLLRTLHHWRGVPYTLHDLAGSTLVQASLSVFWTVLALLAMLAATRRGLRVLWLAGGGLLAVTVVKMFLVDLSFLAGVTRIVSFIGVGVLLLLIGYVSPMPPKAKEASM